MEFIILAYIINDVAELYGKCSFLLNIFEEKIRYRVENIVVKEEAAIFKQFYIFKIKITFHFPRFLQHFKKAFKLSVSGKGYEKGSS